MNKQEQLPDGEPPAYSGERSVKADRRDSEEYAAEIAPPPTAPARTPVEIREPVQRSDLFEESRIEPQNRWLGYTALIIGVLSLFVFPTLFGSLSALLGVIAFFQGNRALGVWSVLLGLISLTGYFLLVPLYA